MKSINKAFLLGRVGQDPEMSYLSTGQAIAKFSLATNSKRGENEHTDWHRITVFGKLAEVVGKYVSKGTMLHVEGRIQYGQWEDKNGEKRSSTDIIVSDLTLLGGRNEAGNGYAYQTEKVAQNRRETKQSTSQIEDDIPF